MLPERKIVTNTHLPTWRMAGREMLQSKVTFWPATTRILNITYNLKTELQKNNINWIFGLIFLIFGSGLVYHSLIDFYTYNFTTVLFIVMRSNSSIIAEFIFGALLATTGILIFINSKNWLNLIKVLAIGMITNVVFALALNITDYIFNWELLAELLVRIVIGFGIYKLTEYLTRINQSEWNFKTEKLKFIIGIVIGLFPFVFRNIFF